MRILIIGQGISGTWLSYWLLQKGAAVLVLDPGANGTASRVASGVINPVTGRQVVTTWLADTLLPFAETHYTLLGNMLQMELLKRTGILSFPPSEQMLQAYQKKMQEQPAYIHPVPDTADFASCFEFSFGAVKIDPAYYIDIAALLSGWKRILEQKGCFREGRFEPEALELLPKGLLYNGEPFDIVVYCDGAAGFQSSFWQGLPFSFNKGEALIADIPGLPTGQIYKFGITTLVPWKQGLWWVGSTYDNRYTGEEPTPVFRQNMERFLAATLKVPFRLVDHLASIRPATVDRRPFIGMHPRHSQVAIFNGMGTKGVSLSPWLGEQMADFLLGRGELEPMVDISRFKRAFL